MSTRKIVYSRSELFKIREGLGLDTASSDAPALPLFRAHGPASGAHASGLEGSGNAPQGSGFGSWRDGGGFGAQSGAPRRAAASGGAAFFFCGAPRRAAASGGAAALNSSPSGSDLAATTTTVHLNTQWVYRTKGRTNKSNPMSIKEIEQLVADELVDSDEIELSRVGSTGADAFISYAEAQAAPTTISTITAATHVTTADVDHTPVNLTPVERWRPGASANGERKAHQRPPHGSATGGLSSSGILERRSQQPQQQHNHLPPKHLSISRDDMLAADDLRRRSPCAVPSAGVAATVTPPSTSPTTGTLLPTPIDVGALALDEHLGLGTVPTPNAGGSLHPFPPQPPCALDIDQEAYIAVSPSGKRTSQTPKPTPTAGTSETPTKMRPPPPPVLCVDEPPAAPPVEANNEVAAIIASMNSSSRHQEASPKAVEPEVQPAPSQSPAKGDAPPRDKKVAARSPAKGQKKSQSASVAGGVEQVSTKPDPAAAAAAPPQSATATQSAKKNGKGQRGTPAVSPTVQQPAEKAPPTAVFVDPAIVAQGPAAAVVCHVVRPVTPEPSDVDQKVSKADRKRDAKKAAASADPWGNKAGASKSPTTKQPDSGKQPQRRSKQTSPAQPTPPSVDTSMYPTMEEILSGDVKPVKAAPRQVKTLASIVAEGGRGVASSVPPADNSASVKPQQGPQQKKANPAAGRGKGSK
ncbi:Hypothetical protein, putative [Bodo saltans]|uniref:Uncharacterized protein n=1 Tax=Bodo saltans TaxID=75058 RepID=A0A0S4J8W9_BODSA|nr:Hypothetical protein, putative [Bodo saltans]|eukprot:CUG87945.1 Hypothetical protein, putative [Bodo saltans]